MKIYIRNMACESCKLVVKKAAEKLKLHPIKVSLGELEIKEDSLGGKRDQLNNEIKKVGLEIVDNKGGIIIEKIKRAIIQYVDAVDMPKDNLSVYLSKKLNYEYNYLSNIFSEIEGVTISNYMNGLKMERAKEYILFEEFSLSEISEKMHYNSLSHFSSQFKKHTGFSPSHFKNLKNRRRKSIQELTAKGSK